MLYPVVILLFYARRAEGPVPRNSQGSASKSFSADMNRADFNCTQDRSDDILSTEYLPKYLEVSNTKYSGLHYIPWGPPTFMPGSSVICPASARCSILLCRQGRLQGGVGECDTP